MKKTLKKIITFLIFLVSLGIIGYLIYSFLGLNIPTLQSKEAPLPTATVATGYERDQIISEIEPYLDAAIEKNKEKVLAYLLYEIEIDHIDINESHDLALVWLAMRDATNGQLLPSEPGLAIATLDSTGLWQITLQADESWSGVLDMVPLEMLSRDRRIQYLSENVQKAMPKDAAPLSGYKLPWAGGEAKTLTGSIGHVFIYRSCVSTCLYAFDFADGTMFPVHAAKGGTVKYAVWDYENGNTEHANYIVLEDTSTTPVTYQVYLHLAQQSIPVGLRTIGAEVQQGDLIGIADDTGYSTGHHLHFHVHTNATSYWGTSVDITFEDVEVNGGRPRTCIEAENFSEYGAECQVDNRYISKNSNDHDLPTVKITSPTEYSTLEQSQVPLHVNLSDASGIQSAELYVKQFAGWQKLSDLPAQTSIDTTLDLCASGLESGPFSVGLIVEDGAGNRSEDPIGIIQLINKNTCSDPASTCTPQADQIALFSGAKYSGECQVFEKNLYNELPTVLPAGWSGIQSILLGETSQAVIYSGTYTSGRIESLLSSDALGEKNRVPFSDMQSMKVQTLGEVSEITLQAPLVNDQDVDVLNSVTLTWAGGEGANTFSHVLSGPNGYAKSAQHSSLPYWSVGSLPAGEYLWSMQAEQNGNQIKSASLSFTVSAASLPAQNVRQAPYAEIWDDLNNQEWFSSGDWKLGTLQIGDWSGEAWIFGDGAAYNGSGDLTSPPISIPAAGYAMNFSSFIDVENTNGVYDRREVQISVDGSNFTPLHVLKEELTQRVWQNSPLFDLSAYAGKSVRFRFHFDTIDNIDNQHLGWVIRNFNVQAVQSTCQAGTSSSSAINFGQLINGTLCSAAEIHTYQINLEKNQAILVNFADQSSTNAGLRVNIKDALGNIMLANQNVAFAFRAEKAGTYQISLLSALYPDGLSGAIAYQLQLTSDTVKPSVSFQTPLNSVITAGDTFTVQANASDDQGVRQINLYWHSPDWIKDGWVKLGSDYNSADGWAVTFNQADISPISNSTLWLEAVDNAGNRADAILWKLRSDQSPPETSMYALPEFVESTLITLAWETTFGADKVAAYEIIYRVNEGSWQSLADDIPADASSYVFVGNGGNVYEFNMRARDIYGNLEAYEDSVIISTTIVDGCTRDPYEVGNTNGDDTWQTATLSVVDTPEIHNICEAGDTDWFALSRENGKYQRISVTPQQPINGLIVTLYDAESMDVLQQENSYGSEDGIEINYTFSGSDEILVQVEPADGNVWGTNTQYEWIVEKPLSMTPIGLICSGTGLPALLLLFKFWKKKEE
ncbi:MAG: M23 family metallopeptidase [Anaerolineaceae bacterium]|nr:M23 family metallopeptidase [Anaerolineaceae bacterium]